MILERREGVQKSVIGMSRGVENIVLMDSEEQLKDMESSV